MTHRAVTGQRKAFSLLEVILAIALSVVIVYLVFGAIDFHLRQLTVRKTGIEEAQLARAILRKISDDLRAVVINRPIDLSSDSQGAQADASSGQSSSVASQDGSSPQDGGQQDEATTAVVDPTTELQTTPGVYGNTYELQVDISHVPRYEEYANLEQYQNTQQFQLLSDVKTVSYFLLGQTGPGSNSSMSLAGSSNSNLAMQAASLGLPPDQPARGLAHRMVDRAAMRYAMQGADSTFLDQYVELIAPEVLLLQFRYFDGQQWIFEWDTEALGGIPLAVEIVLVLRSDDADDDESTELMSGQQSMQDMLWQHDPEHVYRLVVHLPTGEMIDTAAASGDDDAESGNEGAGR